jgi:hypothetical protein
VLLLADALVVVHLAFVAFVVAGGVLVLRWPRLAWVHVPAALWGAAIALGGYVCPLTPLENALREAGGGSAYTTGFIEHYIVPVLYPGALTRPIQVGAGIFLVALNALVYAIAFGPRRTSGRAPASRD